MRQSPRVIGLVVEVPGRRRVFVPMGRVTAIDSGQVITTGLVNMRRFEQRESETLVMNDLLDRRLRLREDNSPILVEDVGIEQQVNKDWEVTRLFVRRVPERSAFAAFRRRGETKQIDWTDADHPVDSEVDQEATQLIAAYQDTKPADLADVLFEMNPGRRLQVARALDDERLADVVEELPAETQVEILVGLETERAVTVLEEMEPDDAADLLGAAHHDPGRTVPDPDGAR